MRQFLMPVCQSVFFLLVPTGLGKTLTSTYWAVKHAKANKLRRVIVVLPFLNIIDQTVQLLAEVFGRDIVLEHHSGVLDDEKSEEDSRFDPQKLATENWDYPIVVTTTVQFFESLFSNKPSKCRKIHNIADSVVIFDEVQTLKQELVLPTLEMLKQVQEVLNTSFLFCTATQPAFEAREGFDGLPNIHHLIGEPQHLFEKTKRVSYSILNSFEPISVEELVAKICGQGLATLVVVNTKKDATAIFLELKSAGNFDCLYHLSTNMCSAHRRATIAKIRGDLKARIKIGVVSTQLIEAGVDFDFPVVYRALAPLESIIQAAGRCNREGRLPALGQVFLFSLKDGAMPVGLYKTCAEHAKLLISSDLAFLDKHDSFQQYYRQVQSLFVAGDKFQISANRKELLFEQVAASYKLIPDDTVPVFVRGYDEESCAIFDRFKQRPILTRSDVRTLQPYLVNFYRQALFKNVAFVDQKSISGIWVWEGRYDRDLGIIGGGFSVEELMV